MPPHGLLLYKEIFKTVFRSFVDVLVSQALSVFCQFS